MKTFLPGQVAVAADVNANFTELVNAVTPTSWVNVTMTSGWAVRSTLRVRRIGKLIELRGQFGRGTNGNDLVNPGAAVIIGTIPAGYRPADQIQVSAAAWQQGASPEERPVVLVITPAGTVSLHTSNYGHAFHTSVVFGA